MWIISNCKKHFVDFFAQNYVEFNNVLYQNILHQNYNLIFKCMSIIDLQNRSKNEVKFLIRIWNMKSNVWSYDVLIQTVNMIWRINKNLLIWFINRNVLVWHIYTNLLIWCLYINLLIWRMNTNLLTRNMKMTLLTRSKNLNLLTQSTNLNY